MSETIEETKSVNTEGGFEYILFAIVFVFVQYALIEFLAWYYITKHEDYQELQERTRNLGKRLK